MTAIHEMAVIYGMAGIYGMVVICFQHNTGGLNADIQMAGMGVESR